MNTYGFMLDHGDAVGTGLIVVALAVIIFVFQDRAHARQMAGQRVTDAALRKKDRAELHARYGRIVAVLAQRRPTFAEEVEQALGHTRPVPVRTPLDECGIDRTVADVPSQYMPVWTGGEVRW